MKRSIAFLSSVLLIVFCFSASILAQETRGEIQGTVKDQAGAVVPNVTITITGVDVGLNRTVQTGDDGYYRARELPPGIYKVSSGAVSGFAAQTQENIQVALGNATTVDFTVGTSGVGATVDVTADSILLDTTETKSQDNISAQEIDRLPKGTGFTSLLRTSVAVRPEPLSGQFSINGSTGPENSFIVDGQETQNFRNGLLNGNNDIPYQSIQEIQIKTSGFEAEFGGATGGVINAVTKSGSNQLRGEFGVMFETQKLNAGLRPVLNTPRSTTIDASDFSSANSGQGVEYLRQGRDQGTNFFPTATLSGPVIKDKVWFFGIYSPRFFTTSRTTNFIQGFGNTGTGRRLPATVPTVIAGAATTQTSTLNRKTEFAQIKLDASPSNNLRISSSFTYNPIIDQGALLGGAFVVGSPAFADFGGTTGLLQGADLASRQGGRQNSNNFRIEANYTPTSKLVATLRYTRGFLNEKLGSYFIPNAPRLRCQSVPTAFVASSGCFTGFQNTTNNSQVSKDVSIRNTVDANASYLLGNLLGRHEFKGGYQYSKIQNDVDRGFRNTGITGLYYGPTTIPGNFTCTSGNSFQPGFTLTPPTLPAGVTIIGRGCTQRFGTAGKATNTANTVFFQDKWQPTNRLTLNLGVRTENEAIPAFNGQQTNLKFNFADKIAPRLGVAYALTGDGKTKISAFYGRFFDRLKFELPRGSFGGDFYRVDYFFITSDHPEYTYYTGPRVVGSFNDPIGGVCPIAPTTGSLTRCNQDYRIPSNLSNGADLGGGAVDPNLKAFQQSEVTVEFQRELMRSSVLTARFLYRNVDHAVEDAGVVNANFSEAYIIGNPGEGLALQNLTAGGYAKSVKPERKYKALQLEYDTRFVSNFNLNLNYTLSRLKGNYSGLASPDENGRSSPNVNRDFDLPFVGFTASGQEANGILPLDRTHVFKASGTYSFDYFGSKSNTTDLSFFTTVQTGLPQTTFITVFGIPIPETKRNDLGRTERFTQTDLNFTHRYRFGRDDRFTMAFDVNAINVFNENNILGLQTTKNAGNFGFSTSDVVASGEYPAAVNVLTSRGILTQYNAAAAAFFVNGTTFDTSTIRGVNAARSASYGLPNQFQEPRSIRFGMRFLF